VLVSVTLTELAVHRADEVSGEMPVTAATSISARRVSVRGRCQPGTHQRSSMLSWRNAQMCHLRARPGRSRVRSVQPVRSSPPGSDSIGDVGTEKRMDPLTVSAKVRSVAVSLLKATCGASSKRN